MRVRRLEAAAIVLLVAASVAGTAALSQSLGYALGLSGKAWCIEVGKVVVDFRGTPEGVEDLLEGLPLGRHKFVETANAVGYLGSTPVSVLLVYNPSMEAPASYRFPRPPSEGEAILYPHGSSMRANGTVRVLGLEMRIVGVAEGVVSLGSAELVLLTTKHAVEKVGNATGTLRSVLLAVPDGDPYSVAEEAARRISSVREVTKVLVNTEEDNPSRGPLEGIGSAMSVLAWSSLGVAVVIIVSSGVIDTEKSRREVAILRSLGAGRILVARYIGSSRLLMGVIGALLGAALSLPLSELLIRAGTSGSENVRILMSEFPFRPSLGPILLPLGVAIAAVAASALLPPALLVRGEVAPSLRGVEALRPRGPGRGPVSGAVFRNLTSRPWKPVALVLVLSLLLGTVASIVMVSRGMQGVAETVRRAPFESLAFVPMELLENASDLGDAYAVIWNGPKLGDCRLTVFQRLGTGPYLWYPLVGGRLPGRGEVLVSQRIAVEMGLAPGSVIEFGGASYRVSGVAAIPDNNGWAVVVPYEGGPADGGMIVSTAGAEELKEELFSRGIPSVVRSKEAIAEGLEDAGSMLGAFLYVVNSVTIFMSLLSVALIGVMDVASREGEMGILRAVGASDLQLSGLQALETLVVAPLAIPPAALLAELLADSMCARLSDAFGFLVPGSAVTGILGALWILPLALGLATAFWLLYLRKREFVLRLE